MQSFYQNALALLNGRASKKIGNNTYARKGTYWTDSEQDKDAVLIRLHATDIVTVTCDNEIVLNAGGWQTVTTKSRMNQLLRKLDVPFGVSQENSVWTLHSTYRSPNKSHGVFQDGIYLDAKLSIHNAAQGTDAIKLLVKQANKYAKEYTQAMLDGKIAAPTHGDCWYCLLKEVESNKPLGEITKNTNHIQSHLDENYFVPSLLSNAIKLYPVCQFTQHFINACWCNDASTNEDAINYRTRKYYQDIARRDINSSLKRYVKHCLSLPT